MQVYVSNDMQITECMHYNQSKPKNHKTLVGSIICINET